MRILITILTLALAYGLANAQVAPSAWPDNARWPTSIDGVSVVLKRDLDVVEVPSDRLATSYLADEIRLVIDLPEGDTFVPAASNIRFIRFSAKSGAVTVPPRAAGAIAARGRGQFGVTPPASWLDFRPEERFGVLAKIQRAGEPVWYAFAVSLKANAPRRPVLIVGELSPSISPAQRLLDGTTATVGRLSFDGMVRNILPNHQGTWFDLSLSGSLSTAMLDPGGSGKVEFQVGRSFGKLSLDRLYFRLGAKSNQSGRASAGYTSLGATMVLPGSYAKRSRVLIIGAAPTLSFGLRAEQRWRRSSHLNPYHSKAELAYSYLHAKLGPIWLFPKNGRVGSFERDWSLSFEFGLYWLPGDDALPGFEKRPIESYMGVTLKLPTRILLFSPELFFHTGAEEGQTFARTSVFGLGLTLRF